MNLNDFDRVAELRTKLKQARQWVRNAKAYPRETFEPRVALDYQRIEFTLPAIPKSQMVSACEREVSKVIAELQQMGVEVPAETERGPYDKTDRCDGA